MELKHATVKADVKEIEAWRNICAKSDVVKRLKFQWDPKCDSLLDGRIFDFFVDLEKRNTSIFDIEMSIFHGEIKRQTDPLYESSTDNFIKEVDSHGNEISKSSPGNSQSHHTVSQERSQPIATPIWDFFS